MSYGQYLKSLLPSILTMIFLSFYTTIDGFFVSRYAGSDALAGINIVIPITCVTFGVAVMLATGAGAIIGEHLGRGEMEQANRIFSFMCLVLLAFSVAFTALGVAFLRPIAVLLGSSERLMPHVLPYALVVFLGTVPMAFKLFFEYLVRSDGNSKVGLAMSVAGLVLNVGLDYLFVGVFGLGTLGAAWGTTLSITASALIGLVYFLRFGNIRFARPKADAKVLLKSCTNGSSEMFTEFSTGITTLLFNLMVMKYFGEDGVAAVTIIMYIYYFFISFYMGIAVAVAPVVSYNVGAQKPGQDSGDAALQLPHHCRHGGAHPGRVAAGGPSHHPPLCAKRQRVRHHLAGPPAVQPGVRVHRLQRVPLGLLHRPGQRVDQRGHLAAAQPGAGGVVHRGTAAAAGGKRHLADHALLRSGDRSRGGAALPHAGQAAGSHGVKRAPRKTRKPAEPCEQGPCGLL